MTKSQEVAQIAQAKRHELANLMKPYDTGQKDAKHGVPIFKFPAEVGQEIDQRNFEILELQKEFEILKSAETAEANEKAMREAKAVDRQYTKLFERTGGGTEIGGNRKPGAAYKTVGAAVIDHPRFHLRNEKGGHFRCEIEDIELKTLLTTAGTPGYVPDNPRTDIVVPYPNRPLRVADLIPTFSTDLSVVKWMEQTDFTNNASMTGEGYTKPESSVDWDEKTTNVRKIAHWMHITQEVMDDVRGFMALIDQNLILMLGLKEEQQILSGSNVGQEFLGILSHTSIQTQAYSSSNADTILKAMTKVGWTGYANVTAVVMHPTDWETARLQKGATNADYVLGSPLIDVTPRLWGVPVVITNAISQGTALVGDFAGYTQIRRKQGVTVEVTNSHSTDFIENKLAVRAEMREAFLILRGSAFCKATGLSP